MSRQENLACRELASFLSGLRDRLLADGERSAWEAPHSAAAAAPPTWSYCARTPARRRAGGRLWLTTRRNIESGQVRTEQYDGVFGFIGLIPNNELAPRRR